MHRRLLLAEQGPEPPKLQCYAKYTLRCSHSLQTCTHGVHFFYIIIKLHSREERLLEASEFLRGLLEPLGAS